MYTCLPKRCLTAPSTRPQFDRIQFWVTHSNRDQCSISSRSNTTARSSNHLRDRHWILEPSTTRYRTINPYIHPSSSGSAEIHHQSSRSFQTNSLHFLRYAFSVTTMYHDSASCGTRAGCSQRTKAVSLH